MGVVMMEALYNLIVIYKGDVGKLPMKAGLVELLSEAWFSVKYVEGDFVYVVDEQKMDVGCREAYNGLLLEVANG